jgi:transcription initiation factor TFIIIB Brf1 subunit/transcription initiation factor TFIIB
MSATYDCPSCHRALAVPAEVAGKSVKCPGCGTVFTARVLDVAPADNPFAITEQKPARSVSAPSRPVDGDEDFRDVFARHDLPSWADTDFPDKGVLAGRSRAAVAITFLLFCALLAGVEIGASALRHQLLQRVENGGVVADGEEETIDILDFVLAVATIALRLGTAVAFAVWFYRAYKNLPLLLATNLRSTPGRAVGSFFIPLVQLFRPYQIAQEIWQASAPDGLVDTQWSWQLAAKSWIVRFWWAFWLSAGVLAWISMRLSLSATTASETLAALEFDMLSDIPEILAAGFAIWVIVRIQRRQTTKWQRIVEERETGEGVAGVASF